MKIKTSELSGAALDWAVAVASKLPVQAWHSYRYLGTPQQQLVSQGVTIGERDDFGQLAYSPSTDWAQGGPIIEREKTDLYFSTEKQTWAAAIWRDIVGGGQLDVKQTGCSTPLIAAMRCFVASKLGDEVDVPQELV